MANSNIISVFSIFIFSFSLSLRLSYAGGTVPAMFVFGDSLVDVGNNNYLTLAVGKADFPYNGIDFPMKQSTGRFSNGKNAADFLAEKVGLPTSPPYLSLSFHHNNPSFLTGVSFASGGAEILSDGTDFTQTIPLTTQVDLYTQVVYKDIVQQLGSSASRNHLSKSLFVVVIGSNDIFGYFGPLDQTKKSTSPQRFVDQMASSLKQQLKRLHVNGARKFVVVGVPSLGCCPIQRVRSNSKECNEEMNHWSLKYNQVLNSTLHHLKSELNDMNYSLFDIYHVLQNFVQKPATYGFKEVKAACCGLGELNANVPCLPISKCCPKRTDHIFWDLVHPTEAAARIAVDYIFDGPTVYSFPINGRHLASL